MNDAPAATVIPPATGKKSMGTKFEEAGSPTLLSLKRFKRLRAKYAAYFLARECAFPATRPDAECRSIRKHESMRLQVCGGDESEA